MSLSPSAPAPRFVECHQPDAHAEREAVLRGLLERPARVEPKWFYDRLGSRLFEAITLLPEYTPTRDEAAIFATHASAIAAQCGAVGTLVDLGAGNCEKAAALLPLLRPRRYLAVDVSVDFLRDALARLQDRHPTLDIVGVSLDFSAALELPAGLVDGAPLFFFPGSSIGNLTPPQALRFLQRLHRHAVAERGGLLIGVDLVRPAAELEAAYDDAIGVTAAFNLNLLRHLNALFGTDFDPRGWRHVAHYDVAQSRIEMHLEARAATTVRWQGGERRFEAGERLLTEYSCKYEFDGFAALLRDAGLVEAKGWTDPRRRFAVFHAGAAGATPAR